MRLTQGGRGVTVEKTSLYTPFIHGPTSAYMLIASTNLYPGSLGARADKKNTLVHSACTCSNTIN